MVEIKIVLRIVLGLLLFKFSGQLPTQNINYFHISLKVFYWNTIKGLMDYWKSIKQMCVQYVCLVNIQCAVAFAKHTMFLIENHTNPLFLPSYHSVNKSLLKCAKNDNSLRNEF